MEIVDSPDHITIGCISNKCRVYRMRWNHKEERYEPAWQSHQMSKTAAESEGKRMAQDLELEYRE